MGYPSKKIIEEWTRDHPWLSAIQLLIFAGIVIAFISMSISDCLHGQ